MNRVLILLLANTLFSCGTGEPMSGQTDHIFKNLSHHKIDFRNFNNGNELSHFSLQISEEYIINIPARVGQNNGPFNNSVFQGNDSVLLYFNDTLVIQYDIGRVEGNPMRIENYVLIESDWEPFIFLFEFTNEDYERALERGRIIE